MPARRASGQTREQLLDGALAVLADHGHAALTMQRVADQVGVDKALLHYYFGSKAGFVAALADHLGDRLIGDVEAAVATLDDPGQVVAAGFGTLWDRVTSEPALHSAWVALAAAGATDEELAPAVRAVRARYRRMVASRLDAMVAAGWVPRLSPAATVTLVLASIDGFTLALLEEGRTAALDEAVAAMQETMARPAQRSG